MKTPTNKIIPAEAGVATPAELPGQTPDQTPGQTLGQTPGQSSGKPPAKNVRQPDGAHSTAHSGETGGPKGPEPTRYGDWERAGRCCDF